MTREAVEAARRATAEFTDRGVPAPARLELIAASTPGHRITAAEVPAQAAGHGPDTALLADH